MWKVCVYVWRYLVNPDQTLQIHYVTAQDAGWYTCKAANDVGVVTVSAQLLVEGKVTIRIKHLQTQGQRSGFIQSKNVQAPVLMS